MAIIRRLYDTVILDHSVIVLFIIICTVSFLGYEARKLAIDASAETLMLEDDKDLRLTREINSRFKSPEILFITYTPKSDALDDAVMSRIRELKAELSELERVKSVITILDVPLLESPPKPIKELLKNVPTLESEYVDKNLAREEFLRSPIYSDNLVSPDFKTVALQVNLHEDKVWSEFIKKRNQLRYKEKNGAISSEEKRELSILIRDFKNYREKVREKEHINIKKVRGVMDKYRSDADLFLGGVTMITDDLISFVKNDLKIFGLGVLIFLIVTLWIIFRQVRWIFLPIICCFFSVISTCGLLGLFNWEVTVISSNFISIQLIITMAVTIHLIVRYRELSLRCPDYDQRQLILETVTSMAKPCSYAILTTMAGFSSLVFCNILPVINFGRMMTAGIGISLILTFLIFPAILMQMKKIVPNTKFEARFAFTKKLAGLTEKRGTLIIAVSTVVMILSISGAAMLMVENSFIDYFKKTTEIYQGMKVIDQKLGGTTPLDVVIDLENNEDNPAHKKNAGNSDESDDFYEFEEEFEEAAQKTQYWFTSEKMRRIEEVHDYLDSIPETGKVLSLATMLKVGKTLNDGKPLDNFELALIYNELPEKFKEIILNPYVSVENNQARFAVRVRDSEPDLRRNELLKKIRSDLTGPLGLKDDRVYLGNLLVLYNNMLQSLFDSQILTLGAVITALVFMFLILFRSVKIALIAIFPNMLSVGVVLGFMGWAGIPLDMMTITIAAISVGIAVDDTIHYIHRFKNEFMKDRNYIAAMHRSHESIGYAMYYTSVTIIIGFSILVLSNFIPSIYFGILTGIAMVIALIAALTLLPQLIIIIKPLGPEVDAVDLMKK